MASIPPPPASSPPGAPYPHPGPPPELPELPEGAPRRPAPSWPAWTAPVALIAAFAAALVGYIVIGAVAGAAGASFDNPPSGVEIGATVVQDSALVLSAVLFARMTTRPRPWQFGLRPTRFGPAVGWLLIAWLSFFVFSAVWI